VYKVEKDSKEWVDRLGADVKGRLDAAVEGGKQALRTGEPAGIRTALDELNAAYSAAGASLYAQQQASGQAEQPAGESQPGGQAKEEVVEADYEIVDENKKP
jgi:molecular chaperone DnaK